MSDQPARDSIEPASSGLAGRATDEDTTRALDVEFQSRVLEQGTQVGRYVLLQPVGRGGMGVVYAAHDPDLDRKIAIKVLHGKCYGAYGHETRSRLFREAQALAKLSHPNVLPIHDVGTFGDDVFIATELVQGQTLRDWMKERRRTWREILDVMIPAGRALAAAHAVDIVHRDFKPTNVMVGNDGRVRVMDFGLARQLADADADADVDAGGGAVALDTDPGSEVDWARSALSCDLTATGTIMGTPAYASPEQLEGGGTDPRGDQFSFCVVMYELLSGTRPFRGKNFTEAARAIQEGWREGPWRRRVPARLRKAVIRGLAPAVDERWPDMTELLDQLESARHRTSRAAVAGLVAMALLGGFAYDQAFGGDIEPPCTGGRLQITEVWGDAQRSDIRSTMLSTEVGHAADTWERVEDGLDDYADAWADAHQEACAATMVRHEQSESLMDQRMACLQKRRWELESLVGVLTTADASVVGKATKAVASLVPVNRCDAQHVLESAVAPISDPSRQREVDDLTRKLARAKALEDAGMTEDGLRVAREVDSEAEELGYLPLIAETKHRLGSLQSRAGQTHESYETLFAATEAADSARMDALAARTKALLVFVAAYRLADVEKAEDWSRHAGAAVRRAGDQPNLAALLEYYRSALAMRNGDLEKTEAHGRRALELWQQVEPRPDLLISNAYNALGLAALESGRYSVARKHFERAVDSAQRILGPMHPNGVLKRMNVANVEALLGRFSRAAELYAEGLRVFDANGMGASQEYAGVLTLRAKMLTRLGDWTSARKAHERAVALEKEIDGPEHPSTAAAIQNWGEWFYFRGDFTSARKYWQQALTIHERAKNRLGTGRVAVDLARLDLLAGAVENAETSADAALEDLQQALGPRHAEVAAALVTTGEVDLAQGSFDHAAKQCRRAAELVIGELGPRHEVAGAAYGCMGAAALELGDFGVAAEALEKGLSAAEAQPVPRPDVVPSLRFALGRALVEGQLDPARGRRLVDRAVAEWRDAGEWTKSRIAEAERWKKTVRPL